MGCLAGTYILVHSVVLKNDGITWGEVETSGHVIMEKLELEMAVFEEKSRRGMGVLWEYLGFDSEYARLITASLLDDCGACLCVDSYVRFSKKSRRIVYSAKHNDALVLAEQLYALEKKHAFKS